MLDEFALLPSWFRYLVAVTSDLDKVSHTLDRLLPLVSPRDSVVLIHIVDECAEDVLAGDMVDVEEVMGCPRLRHGRCFLSCWWCCGVVVLWPSLLPRIVRC